MHIFLRPLVFLLLLLPKAAGWHVSVGSSTARRHQTVPTDGASNNNNSRTVVVPAHGRTQRGDKIKRRIFKARTRSIIHATCCDDESNDNFSRAHINTPHDWTQSKRQQVTPRNYEKAPNNATIDFFTFLTYLIALAQSAPPSNNVG